MVAALLTLVPTGLALGLLAFGHYGRRHVRPTLRSAALVGVLAFVLGPVAVATLGFFVWLLLVAVVVAALTMAAVLRPRTPVQG